MKTLEKLDLVECAMCPRNNTKNNMCYVNVLKMYDEVETIALCHACASMRAFYSDECMNNDKRHVTTYHNV